MSSSLVGWAVSVPFERGAGMTEAQYEADCRRTTIWRKVKEAIYAMALEAKFSKQEILTIYLNRAYMGGSARGPSLSARGVSAPKLTKPPSMGGPPKAQTARAATGGAKPAPKVGGGASASAWSEPSLPPVDEHVLELTVVTPGGGTKR
mgnify:CR=1 FL=1